MGVRAGTPDPELEAMVDGMRVLVPTLRERSAHCEEIRRIPDETVADCVRLGVHRIAQPTRFGGLGLGIDAVARVAIETGVGCCSTAWMAGQWPGHNFMVGYFGLEAQEEYWADSPDTLSSSASAFVRFDCVPTTGGYRISGRARFSSGVDAADWLLLMTPEYLLLIPVSEVEIDDDWYVSGLRGTGSKSIQFDDVFVPERRAIPTALLMAAQSPGSELYPGNPYYRVPMRIVLNTMLLSPLIGMLMGLFSLFEERVYTRRDGHSGMHAFERPGTQLRFAEATAKVQTARLLLDNVLGTYVSFGSAGETMSMLDRATCRRDITYAAKQCVEASNLLLESGDAGGHYEDQPLQRWGRDIHMGALQMSLTWDEPAISYSQVRWGLDPVSRFT